MKTIAERAREYAKNEDLVYGTDGYEYCLRDYIKGATEQKVIDIDKACKWMKEQVYQEYGGGPLERLIPDTSIEEFRKAMEE